MGTYKKPQKHLHREFMYLNHDTILNSLSALEAGKIDEIIQKVSEDKEGGLEAGIKSGPVKAGGGKKKATSVQEELVRTRTWFSAFDSWHKLLDGEEALGTFDEWDAEVRDALEVGDTIEFSAVVTLSPFHKVFRTFLSFAAESHKQDSPFYQKGPQQKETKMIARQITTLLGGSASVLVYIAPEGIDHPRMVAVLDEQFMVSPAESLEGRYTVIAQVEQLLEGSDSTSAIRILRDVPPTPLEVETISEAMEEIIEPAKALGVEVGPDDVTLSAPAVVVRPIAIFR